MKKYHDWSIIDKYNKKDGDFFYYVNYRGKDKKKFQENKKYIMKTLNNQKDIDRRSMMLREISNLRSLNHPGIAKIFDTNVELFEDLSNKLFFVTEFIEGSSLKEMIKDNHISFEEKMKSFIQLIHIMNYCHENGVYHQHLQPNNIICRNDNILDLVLIDYGLSFNVISSNGMPRALKNIDQQFLNLPELGKYQNFQKHDPRSDITLCCGILFYMLTELYPLYLLDHYLLKPHQRASGRIKLKEISGVYFDKLNRIFDIAFNIDIDKRFQSFHALLLELQDDHYNIESDSTNKTCNLLLNRELEITKFQSVNDSESISVLVKLSSQIDKSIKFVANKLGDLIILHLKEKIINYPNYSLQLTYECSSIDQFINDEEISIHVILNNSEIVLFVEESLHRIEITRIPIADFTRYYQITEIKLKSFFDNKLRRHYNVSEAFA